MSNSGGQVVPVTHQKSLVGGLRMGQTGDDEIHQIVQRDQAALVVHRAQRQGPATLHGAHEGGKVGLDIGTTHQGEAADRGDPYGGVTINLIATHA